MTQSGAQALGNLTILQKELLLKRLRSEAAAGPTPPAEVPIRVRDRSEPCPLSPMQERLWFLDQLNPAAGRAYNMAGALRLEGDLDRAALARALDALVTRHESLRTTFPMAGGVPTQHVGPDTQGCELAYCDLSLLGEEARGEALAELSAVEAAWTFDLASGPLLRTTLVRLAPRKRCGS
jgi:hypothetical protein